MDASNVINNADWFIGNIVDEDFNTDENLLFESKNAFMGLKISAKHFNYHCVDDHRNLLWFPEGKRWWIGGMGAYLDHDAFLVTDEPPHVYLIIKYLDSKLLPICKLREEDLNYPIESLTTKMVNERFAKEIG